MYRIISKKLFAIIILIYATMFFISGCNVIKTIESFGKLKYKISSATDFNLAGININEKKSLQDFNSLEVLKLTTSFVKGNLPLSFILNVEAKNSDEKNLMSSEISISSFPYKLFLNDKEILQGNIDKPIYLPKDSGSILIPLKVQFDLAQSFKDKSFEDILNFVLSISGIKNSTSNIKLVAQPTLNTPIGEIKSPKEITIVDQDYN